MNKVILGSARLTIDGQEYVIGDVHFPHLCDKAGASRLEAPIPVTISFRVKQIGRTPHWMRSHEPGKNYVRPRSVSMRRIRRHKYWRPA
ncbi:hypothetical protein [Paraburkholderia sp. WP4_3_2]|uniref:hypothetical protein n=1 Tax=Paraburkholderia sp. WP4_3_2 TaxID=2587162 RepID=UPI001622CFC7|nr:hypothetical protein [Paraburkholderia sp. WP4_3_2]MBB3256882.1 hypothetical protein [Paraburkholderia sp. WP4_3_2]